MASEITRELRLRITCETDQAASASKSLTDAQKRMIRDVASEQDKSDVAYVRAIKLKLKAEADLAREIEGRIRQREKEQEKADQAYLKAVRAKLKAEKELEAEKSAAARKEQAEQDKADAAYIKATKARLKAEKDLEAEKERGAAAARREQDRADAAYEKAVRKQLAAERQIERERERAALKAQRQVEKDEAAYVRAVQKKLRAEKELEEQQERQNRAMTEGTANAIKMVAAFAGLNSVSGVVSAMTDHFDKIRDNAFRTAEDVMRMRGAVRELQALRDQMGQTDAGVAHVMQGAAQTLQTPEQYQEMELAGLGVGELAIKNKDDRAEFEKAMVAAGRMAAVEGGDSGAYGQMMGQIALQGKGPLNARDMSAQAERLYQIQRPGGFRTMTQALGQYSQNNAYVMNNIYSPEELMGLTSAFSVGDPASAGTKVDQFTRAMMAGRLRSRGMRVADDVDFVRSDKYFSGLGITDQDSAMDRGRKVAADLKAQEAAAQRGGKKFNAVEYLMSHGIVNQQDAMAIMDYAGLRNSGRLEKIEEAMTSKPDAGAIDRRFEERLANDPLLRNRQTEALGRANDVAGGLREEPLVEAQRAAFERLRAQRKVDPNAKFEDWRGRGFAGRMSDDILFGGYHSQVNEEAQRAMSAERKKLGLPAFDAGTFSEEEGMRRNAREIRAAGGDLRGDVAGQLRQINEGIQKLVTIEDRKQQGRAGQAMPNAVPPMARGNGARQ